MELKDTIAGMTSPDYKERFKAEYQQVKIRYTKLKALLNKWDAYNDYYERKTFIDPDKEIQEFLGFKPSCSYRILREQLEAMEQYLHCLEVRAVIEGVGLE
mgnify:CR=1 FL=1